MKEVSAAAPPLALAVLSLLEERPMHPYELAYTMRERHLEKHIKLNFGSLYHTVENLHRQGWIETVETNRDGRRPERTVYTVTAAGVDALRRSLGVLLGEPVKEYTRLEAGLCFMHHLPAAEKVELLEERATRLESWLEEMGFLHRMLLEQRGLTRLSLIEVELEMTQRKSEMEWARRTAAEIREGTLEWIAGFREKQRKDEVKVE